MKATMLAMLPPLTRIPSHLPGSPMNSESQRMHSFSISVAIGDSAQAPQFGFTAAASSSASAPTGAADDVMYPQNRGLPLWVDCSKKVFLNFSITGPMSVPFSGILSAPSFLRIASGKSGEAVAAVGRCS